MVVSTDWMLQQGSAFEVHGVLTDSAGEFWSLLNGFWIRGTFFDHNEIGVGLLESILGVDTRSMLHQIAPIFQRANLYYNETS